MSEFDTAPGAPDFAKYIDPGLPPSAPDIDTPEEDFRGKSVVRMADAAQYARPPIPAGERGKITVRLLNATPDPLGSIAALCAQYEGRVIRDLSEVTDAERRTALDNMGKTVLNGPLEAAQFHWQIEGVTRSITHQMVRSRASFFAQESLRFAVPEGDWAEEIPLPPWLAGARAEREAYHQSLINGAPYSMVSDRVRALDAWEDGMINAQSAYSQLTDLGMPAEEARGVLPHDMPTRIHVVHDLRTLLAEAGKRTCTQAQFPWRLIFAGMANALRQYGHSSRTDAKQDWQFSEIANRLRPVCYQTGSCGFMAQFDRSCNIRERVDAFASENIPSSQWPHGVEDPSVLGGRKLLPIHDYEWAANPAAARS